MIQPSDVAGLISIEGAPPSAATIADLRRKYARAKPFEPGSVSLGLGMCMPLGLDIATSLVAAGIESCIPDPVGDLLADRPLAMERDWGTGVAGRYVDAVKSMGRPLISAEVDALSSYRAVETFVPTILGAVKDFVFPQGDADSSCRK